MTYNKGKYRAAAGYSPFCANPSNKEEENTVTTRLIFVGGFLGAGKTTLLLRAAEMPVLVLRPPTAARRPRTARHKTLEHSTHR